MTNYSWSVLKSNGLHRPENLPVKFGFSPKSTSTNIAKKLLLQRCSKPLFSAFFNFSHKWPTFAFTGESGYTLAFANRIAHSGLHGETGAIQMGALLLPSDCFTRFGNPAWPGGRTANFAAFGPWSGVLPKNAESLRDSDALMRVAVPRRRGPAGLRDLFVSDEITVFTPCAQGFPRVRDMGGITTLGVRFMPLKRWTPAGHGGVFAVFMPPQNSPCAG